MPLSVVGPVSTPPTPSPDGNDWNLSIDPERFWIYEAKVRDCPITPHFRQRGRCGTCGTDVAEKGSGFCGDECARLFVVNHNWDLARFAAMHRDQHTCCRCGYRTTSADPSQDLVVRHLEIPRSGNLRGRGCHQHLTNLETLCRMCDEADRTAAPAAASHQANDAVLFTTSPAVTALQPPHTTVKPHELGPGLCRQPSTAADPEFWFTKITRRDAQKICASCPVRVKCAKFALDMGVTDGVFAGVALPGRRHARTLRERQQALREIVGTASGQASAHVPADDHPATEMERAGA